jgi:hypothetical protein
MILETERLFLRNWLTSDVRQYIILANDVGYSCFSAPAIFWLAQPRRRNRKSKIEWFSLKNANWENIQDFSQMSAGRVRCIQRNTALSPKSNQFSQNGVLERQDQVHFSQLINGTQSKSQAARHADVSRNALLGAKAAGGSP